MNKHQKTVFVSAALTFIYIMVLLMYEEGLLADITVGLVVLATMIIGGCIAAIYVWVIRNPELIDKICNFKG